MKQLPKQLAWRLWGKAGTERRGRAGFCWCNAPAGANRYCPAHQAEYMREWRKAHPPTKEQRRRSNARSYTRVYINRGVIKKLPCEVCGAEKVQPHHADYSKPLLVRWLCRHHHHLLHKGEIS